MTRGLLVLVMAAGCGAAVVPESADTTSSTSIAATTAMLDSTAPTGPSTSSSEAGSTSTDGYELPKLDVAGPDVGSGIIETCASTGAEIVDLTVVTPSGPFAATHAWWAWEQCCINDPWLVLAAAPQLEVPHHDILTPHVMVKVPGKWESSEPFVGPVDVILRDVDVPDYVGPIAGLEISEPLDPEAPVDPTQSFVGTFAIDGGGWTIQGSVSAPYCLAIQYPACPCE